MMKTWFLWPLLVGVIVLATDTADDTDVQLPTEQSTTYLKTDTSTDSVSHIDTTEADSISSTPSIPSVTEEENEVKVSFLRGKAQQVKKPEKSEDADVENVVEALIEKKVILSNFSIENVSTSTTVKPEVKALRAKIRPRKPYNHRRVFADRVFGKKYGQGRPKVVMHKLKHDLFHNSTKETDLTVKENLITNESVLASSRKRKRDLKVWKSLSKDDRENLIRKLEQAPEAFLQEEKMENKPPAHDENVNNTETYDGETDLEPPKKALLTYRQFVEKKLSKFSRFHGPNLESVTKKEISVAVDESDEIGGLPYDRESAPLEENVLSEMAAP